MTKAAVLTLGVALAACSRRSVDEQRSSAPPAVPSASAAPVARPSLPSAASVPLASAAPAAVPSGPCGAGPTELPSFTTEDDSIVVFAAWDRLQAEPRDQLLCITRDGATRVVLRGHEGRPDAGPEDALTDFDEFVLAPDRRTLYFSSSAWATERAAHVVDLVTGKERFIHDGRVVQVLDGGPWKGMLLVGTTRLDDAHPVDSPQYQGRGVVFFVVSPAGKTLARVPEDEKAATRMLGTARRGADTEPR